MNGHVSAHQGLLNITFRLPDQPDLEIEYVVDTGFVGYLTLPLTAVLAMNLPFIKTCQETPCLQAGEEWSSCWETSVSAEGFPKETFPKSLPAGFPLCLFVRESPNDRQYYKGRRGSDQSNGFRSASPHSSRAWVAQAAVSASGVGYSPLPRPSPQTGSLANDVSGPNGNWPYRFLT